MNTASGSMTKYFAVYLCILALAGLQVFMAFHHEEGARLLLRFLLISVVEAGLAITYLMHMETEKRSLFFSLIPVTIFVLAMMNVIWSDSFRLLHMRPFAN